MERGDGVERNQMCWNLSEEVLQTHERYNRTLFIWTKHNVRIVEIITFTELQNDTVTAVKR